MGAIGARIRNSWGGGRASLPHQYLIIITRATSGIIFFGEVLGVEKIVGGAVILLGVYLAGGSRQRRRRPSLLPEGSPPVIHGEHRVPWLVIR
jgi:hypothetical protein